MTAQRRSPDQTQVSISLPTSLLETIDRRSKELGLNRSQYIRLTLEMDLKTGKPDLSGLLKRKGK